MAELVLTAMVAVALALVATATTLARAKADDPKKVDAWFTRLSHSKCKTTRLPFAWDKYARSAKSCVQRLI